MNCLDLTPEEQAKSLWKIHNFYWADDSLEAKQRITIFIQQIQRTLRKYGINDSEYWDKVGILIYEME